MNNKINKNVDQQGSILLPQIRPGNKNQKSKFNLKNSKALRVLAVFLFVFIAFGTYFGIAGYQIYKNGMILAESAKKFEASTKAQNLVQMKADLQEVKTHTIDFSNSYKSIAWLTIVPWFGNYIDDGTHGLRALSYGLDAGEVGITIIEPYADILGFGSTDPGHDITAQERIDFIVKTIPELIPKSDQLADLATKINTELSYINPNDYPESFRGKEIRKKLAQGKEYADLGTAFIVQGKPLLEEANYLLGVDAPRTYLVLFQNDKELRPTGGFITAYSIGRVTTGKFEPVISDDIYNLDERYKPTITAPKPIIDYIKGPYTLLPKLRLRDMNWDPSFPESMKTFSEEVVKTGIEKFDGIIAVDTQLLVNLLSVIGPVDVPGYGKFSNEIVSECDCPQVIYELESFADQEGAIVWSENEPGKIVFAPPNYENRKKIIGPLMNGILSSTLGQPKEKIPLLFEAGLKSLFEKHVLMYSTSEKTQKALADFGIAGSIKDYTGDYLMIIDANLGGRKSNLYVTQDVTLDTQIKNGKVVNTLTITYKNPQSFDGWLNSVLPNYTRVYIPIGSKVVDVNGFTQKEDPFEEHGKTVVAGFFELRPQGVSKVSITYESKVDITDTYNLFIQKQPGKDAPLYTVTINGRDEEFFLKTDKEIKFGL